MAREPEMSIFDRAMMVAVSLLALVASAVVIATALGWQGVGSFFDLAHVVSRHPIEAFAFGIVVLLAGLHVLYHGIQSERDDSVRQETELGHVRISMRAIGTLVHRAARGVKGIRDVDVTVHPSPEGVAIHLSLVVQPDTPVPTISDEVTRLVRDQVRETVGIAVGDVSIEVRNFAGDARPRVE